MFSILRQRWKAFSVPALLFVMTAASAAAKEVEGVAIPDQTTVAGKTLALNGAGLRTATILNVRVWVGAFYAPSARRSQYGMSRYSTRSPA